MKGWYIAARPGTEGDTTIWYTSFWYFIAKYAGRPAGGTVVFDGRPVAGSVFGENDRARAGDYQVAERHNNTQKLMYDTSLLVFQSEIPDQVYKEPEYGLNLYPLAEALVYATPRYFQVEKIAARTCLAMIRDAADILKVLTKNGASLRAGRIAGAFRNIGNSEIADSIVSTMRGFGYDVREEDPFEDQPRTPLVYEVSPYVTRLRLMWENMRDKVVELFPEAPGKIDDVEGYLRSVDEKYSEDAYHSLSIEGYRVSPELIEKVRVGNWKPEKEDKEHKNALVHVVLPGVPGCQGDDLRYTERKERRGSGKGGSSGLVYADVDAVRYGGDLAKGGYCGLSYRAGLYTGIATYPVEPESGQGRYARPFRSLEE